MKGHLLAALSGLLFAIGLGVGGMTDANKVIGFLDISGGWDPSLALVMGGAIGVHLPLYRWVTRSSKPWFRPTFDKPNTAGITPRLIGGSVLFGLGWGLGGFCPGPGLVSLASGSAAALVFVGTLSIGTALVAAYDRRNEASASAGTVKA